MTPRPKTRLGILALALALAPALASGFGLGAERPHDATEIGPDGRWPKPTELFHVERVVDGDTIHVRRDGEYEKLRLLSVDTEEKLSFEGSPSKPGTVFGEETSIWARETIDALGPEPKVGLRFPDGIEARDVYGRLLCHVVLPDGTDFNLRLVELGKSPYFNKYGQSRLCHDAFVAAQERARAQQLGVWNPKTNEPKTAGAPAAKRPYDRLLPWWDARAEAVESFRVADARNDTGAGDAASPDDMAESLAAERERVRVFGQLFRTFDEDDGSLTLLFRGDRDRAFRALVPAAERAKLDVDLEAVQAEFRQNYLWVEGELEPGSRGGWQMACSADAIALAGPEPFELERADERSEGSDNP